MKASLQLQPMYCSRDYNYSSRFNQQYVKPTPTTATIKSPTEADPGLPDWAEVHLRKSRLVSFQIYPSKQKFIFLILLVGCGIGWGWCGKG